MARPDIEQLYDYHYWCNNHILSYVDKLTLTQYTKINAFPMATVHGTLAHLVGAEFIWLRRLRDGVSEKALLKGSDFVDLEAIKERWQDLETQFRTWLSGVNDAGLSRKVAYHTQWGGEYQTPVWQILQHVTMHGMQHRAEIAQMLTEFGHSPGNIDYMVYVRDVLPDLIES